MQLNQIVRSELERIPRLMRNVMLLRDIQGLPIEDVANQLGMTYLRRQVTPGSRTLGTTKPNVPPLPADVWRLGVVPDGRALNRVGRHLFLQVASQ